MLYDFKTDLAVFQMAALGFDFGVVVQQQNMITPHMKTNSKAIITHQSQSGVRECLSVCLRIYMCE